MIAIVKLILNDLKLLFTLLYHLIKGYIVPKNVVKFVNDYCDGKRTGVSDAFRFKRAAKKRVILNEFKNQYKKDFLKEFCSVSSGRRKDCDVLNYYISNDDLLPFTFIYSAKALKKLKEPNIG